MASNDFLSFLPNFHFPFLASSERMMRMRELGKSDHLPSIKNLHGAHSRHVMRVLCGIQRLGSSSSVDSRLRERRKTQMKNHMCRKIACFFRNFMDQKMLPSHQTTTERSWLLGAFERFPFWTRHTANIHNMLAVGICTLVKNIVRTVHGRETQSSSLLWMKICVCRDCRLSHSTEHKHDDHHRV